MRLLKDKTLIKSLLNSTFAIIAVLANPYQTFDVFTGPVVGVIDGDSIRVMRNGRAEQVRLHGIDCPEKGQAFGNKAKQATSELIFGKEVTLQIYGED